MRVDKLTLAALEATLRLYLDREVALNEIPVLQMLTARVDDLNARATNLVAALRNRGHSADVVASESSVGGGAFPTARIESRAVAPAANAERLESKLRCGDPPVIGRIEENRFQR